jgi:hypothetical protein
MPMSYRVSRVALTVLLLAATAACTSSSPAQPSGGAASSRSASIAAPRPAQPNDGAQILYSGQPVTLVVQNAIVTQTGSTTYTFEVATDTAFSAKVQTKDGVSEGSGGQTSVKLDQLAGSTTYYWHARAQGGGTIGVFGPTYKMTIGPAITINVPIPIAPLTGAATSNRPTLIVANAARSGPAGPITYRFEVAGSSAFSPVTVTATVNEGSAQTSYTLTSDLTSNQTYYWRVTALDAANGASSPASPAQSFTTSANTRQAQLAVEEGVPLWPGAQPGCPAGQTTCANGHATMGDNWGVQHRVSFSGVPFVSPPIDTLQIFDLMDRGFAPQEAIDWLHSHGYPGGGVYYNVGPGVDVIGFEWVYISRNTITGAWDLIIRSGA